MEEHSSCISGNAALACSLFKVLVPAITEAAVVLQLPPERHPDSWDWAAAAQVAGAIASLFMEAGGKQALQAALHGLSSGSGSSGSGGDGLGARLRLLQSAAQLVFYMPSVGVSSSQAE